MVEKVEVPALERVFDSVSVGPTVAVAAAGAVVEAGAGEGL